MLQYIDFYGTLIVIMNAGPYKTIDKSLSYGGNKLSKPIPEVRNINICDLSKRHLEVSIDIKKWHALITIWHSTFEASNSFMKTKNALLFDLPITTRMISSPGALMGTIISDVDPFEINFFNQKTYLTQSSQLYLEFAITNPKINNVYCWEKSFRREKADFRHLPEFTHIEFEGNINFEQNLMLQQEYLQFIIGYLLKNNKEEIKLFLKKEDMDNLEKIQKMKNFEIVTFKDAFTLLFEKTKNTKYKKVTIKNFGAYEEVLLTEIIGRPLFVINYIGEEVAFYHASNPTDNSLAINADFLFPGYGELMGSGERVHSEEETKEKAKHFNLNMDDYRPYIESRTSKYSKVHSGWGMGVERFIQCILKLPFIWETKLFPRIDRNNRP